ncbi:MAG TPA: hypothetical protein VKE71_15730 [Candidatus Angelobacter sp.]|nr:hypothetical protein [Candidatus Angelobacter sp.]
MTRTAPKTVFQKLRDQKVDPDSTTVRELVEEVAERVLRNLEPPQPSAHFPLKPKTSGA